MALSSKKPWHQSPDSVVNNNTCVQSCYDAGEVTEVISIPSTKVGLVMGRGGETIRHICLHSGAHCQVDKNAPDGAREKNIVIKGRPGNVQKAKVSFNRRKLCVVNSFFQFEGDGKREGWGLEPAVFHQPDRVRGGGAAGLQPAVGGVLSVGVASCR